MLQPKFAKSIPFSYCLWCSAYDGMFWLKVHRTCVIITCCLYCARMNLVETHFWQNDDWKDQYVGVVPRDTNGKKVKSIYYYYHSCYC